jgi:hypothetical protein
MVHKVTKRIKRTKRSRSKHSRSKHSRSKRSIKSKRTRSIKRKHSKPKTGGMSPPPAQDEDEEQTAIEILATIPQIPFGNNKTVPQLMVWLQTWRKNAYEVIRNIEPYTKAGIYGSRTLSPIYTERYKSLPEIWGYNANPYINYELLTHHSYDGQPLRIFQYFTDPLMRNLRRLKAGRALLPSDTTEFLKHVGPIIDFLAAQGDQAYIGWFCDTVLPHFLNQGNIATLLYELATQQWQPAWPNNDDEKVLVFLSLVARLFLLLVVRDWQMMRELLTHANC